MDEEFENENDDDDPDNDGIFTAHTDAIDHAIPSLNGFARMGLGGMKESAAIRSWR